MYCLRIRLCAKTTDHVITLAGAGFKSAEECEARLARIPSAALGRDDTANLTIDKLDPDGAVRQERPISRLTAEALIGRSLGAVIAACTN